MMLLFIPLLLPILLLALDFDFLFVGGAPQTGGAADGFLFLLLLVAARLSSTPLNLCLSKRSFFKQDLGSNLVCLCSTIRSCIGSISLHIFK